MNIGGAGHQSEPIQSLNRPQRANTVASERIATGARINRAHDIPPGSPSSPA